MSTTTRQTPRTTDVGLADDIRILNRSLSGEYFGVAAYEVAINSGLLEEGVVQVAKQFQRDHEQHADSLVEAIHDSGGTPVTAATWEEMAAEFPPPPLSNQEDVLRYASSLESSAASGEIVAVSELNSPTFRTLLSRIAGVEAMHWAVLRSALGEDPVPGAFIPIQN